VVGPRLRHEWALIRRHWDIVASLSLLAVTLITERVLRPAVPPVMRLPRLFSLLAVTSTAYLSRQLALQRLLAETRLRRLQRTHQAALRIGAQVSLPAVVATTADEARQLSGAAWALVHLTDPLPGVETPHLHGPLTPGVLAGSPWLADLATRVRDRGPLWLSDWRRDPSLRAAAPPGLPAGSLLAVPLLSGTRSLGVLILGNKPDDAGFTADDAAILTLLAAHAALALERTRLYAEAQQRAAELLEERERREMFVSAVAHELRGAMTPLLGYLYFLDRWETLAPDRQATVKANLRAQIDRLNRLVSDLLDVSRIAAGRFHLERTTTDLVAIAREVVAAQQATTTRHRLMLEAPPSLPGRWDPDRLAQALTNLLSNAIKYTPEGGEIRVRLWSTDREVCVAVTDPGIGLRPEDLPLLFQPYSRLYRERRARGLGLGLYITRAIVEAHGGRIWAESPGPGRGSTFTFCLPRD